MLYFPKDYRPLNPKAKMPTETSFVVNALGFLIGILALNFMKGREIVDPIYNFCVFTTVVFGSIFLLEGFIYGENSPFGRIYKRRYFSLSRWTYKVIGLGVTFLGIASIYALFNMYDRPLFNGYFKFLNFVMWKVFIAGMIYFAWMDCYGEDEKGDYWKIGHFLIHQKNGLSKDELANFIRGWGVKVFFFALMQAYMMDKINWFMHVNTSDLSWQDPIKIFFFCEAVCFFIDLSFASVGYISSLKVANTHIRTAEPTCFGWLVAVICYWPFWGMLMYPMFFDYFHKNRWLDVFTTGSVCWYAWAAGILLLEFIYAMATVALGTRFSNLTYRGICTDGPYKWCKHPAYVCKNISWWMVSMPFMLYAQDWKMAVRCCICLLCVNMIYFLRARTEEKHLSHYPEYRAYALYMNDKSVFKIFAKYLPFLKYKVEKRK